MDERLLATPSVALERCNYLVCEMAELSVTALKKALNLLSSYDATVAEEIRKAEDRADHYEDILGTYLVKLSSYQIGDEDSAAVSKLLKVIGDFERISDHSINIVESAEELDSKGISFTSEAEKELGVMCSAVSEILTLSYQAFVKNDLNAAREIEPLEDVIDGLKDKLRNGHVQRLKDGACSIEVGFVWADLITNLERTADHCSNIAVCVMDASEHNMNIHESLRLLKNSDVRYSDLYEKYAAKYVIAK